MPAVPSIAVVDNQDGTVTVTVSGSDSGTTNTVLTMKVDSAWPGNAWVPRTPTRSGDGDITVSIDDGTYWFAVSSDGGSGGVAWSAPVMRTVAEDVPDIYSQIFDGVVTRIRLLSLSGIESGNVTIHDVLTVKAAREVRKSSIIVGPPDDTLVQLPDGGNTTNHFGYPVVIAMVAIANRDEETNTGRWFKWGERIRNAFVDLPLPVAQGCVYQAEYIPFPVFDKEWWSRNAAVSFVGLRFKSSERKGM